MTGKMTAGSQPTDGRPQSSWRCGGRRSSCWRRWTNRRRCPRWRSGWGWRIHISDANSGGALESRPGPTCSGCAWRKRGVCWAIHVRRWRRWRRRWASHPRIICRRRSSRPLASARQNGARRQRGRNSEQSDLNSVSNDDLCIGVFVSNSTWAPKLPAYFTKSKHGSIGASSICRDDSG